MPVKQEDFKGREFDCYGILGIVNIQGHNFLVTVAGRGFAAKLSQGVNIYEVQSINLNAFKSSALNLEQNKELAQSKEYFERLFNGANGQGTGFYFSYHSDLSISQQETFRRKQAN